MKLKRKFKPDTIDSDAPVVDHVEILTQQDIWKPTRKILDKGIADGWLSIVDGDLIIKTAPGEADARYKVDAPPGRYCCHCGEPLGSEKAAKDHVAAEHAGIDSPSANDPAGYAMHNFYLTHRVGG